MIFMFLIVSVLPEILTLMSLACAPGAVMRKDVAWLHFTNPRASPFTAAFVISVTMKENGLPMVKLENYEQSMLTKTDMI